jgi:flagellar capping protein FliD
MAGIQSLGVGSGLLTSDLVDQLVSAERAASDLRLDSKSARIDAKISAFAEVRTVLGGVHSAIGALSEASTIQGASAKSSDDTVLTATTSSLAEQGNYRVDVDAIAQSHSLASKRYESVDDSVGTGSITFSFGTTSYDGNGDYSTFEQDSTVVPSTLVIGAGNNSLGGVRDAINRADFGVNASLVYDGQGYRLLLTSDETGAEQSMQIEVSGDAGLQSLAYNSSQQDSAVNMAETQKGSDAVLRVNGLQVTSSSNKIDQVIRGVSISLTKTTDSTMNLTVSRDVDDIADKMDTFVEKYNEYRSIYDQLVAYNPDDNVGGILLGDNNLREVHLQMRSSLTEMISGITGSAYHSLVEVGLSTDQTQGYNLVFDRDVFTAAMDKDARGIVGLLATDTQTSDSLIEVVTPGISAKPGTYDINISQLATQGQLTGLSAPGLDFASNVTISDVNDGFSLVLDGKTQNVQLTQGSYSSGNELALMMQTSINSAFTGQSATVAFDQTNQSFSLTSNKYGSSSKVQLVSADPMIAQTLGLTALGGGQAVGNYFSSLSDVGFSASSAPGTMALTESQGANFEANPISFDLTLTGTTADGLHSVSLNENWADIIGFGGAVTTDRDRSDVLTYIQSELNNAGLSGVVSAEFNSSDRLIFRTDADDGAQTLAVSNVVVTGNDSLGIEASTDTSGITVGSAADMKLSYANRYGTTSSSTITLPTGVYETAAAMALALQNQINADSAINLDTQGAMTEPGARNMIGAIDFSTDAAQFVLKDKNGTENTITVSANGASNLASVQAAIDAELGANIVTASLGDSGLVLTTVGTGADETLEIVSDGVGATTDAGSVDLSSGVDFAATPATFTLKVDGEDVEVNVIGDGTAGTNNGASNLVVIQQALDTALAQAGVSGVFKPGDVVAKLDASNHLIFETVSKAGAPTEATFGADSSIEITVADAAALGIVVGGQKTNGKDSFGLEKGLYQGFDGDATVSYDQDEDGSGRFVIAFDNDTDVTLLDVSDEMSLRLGLANGNGAPTAVISGSDVAGTINGITAKGIGQFLTGADGANVATGGYVVGGTAMDLSAGVTIDDTNNALKVTVDGVTSGQITLTNGVYGSGAALAAQLKAKINADSILLGDNKVVDVRYDEATNAFGIISQTKGASSTVSISDISSGAVNTFGLTASTQGIRGKDASGSIDDSAGIVLKVGGSQVGERGTVIYVQGVMSKLDDLFESILSSKGSLTSKEARLVDQQDEILVERAEVDDRASIYETRLRAQFLYNDKMISQLKTIEDFLTQQFEAMNNSNK